MQNLRNIYSINPHTQGFPKARHAESPHLAFGQMATKTTQPSVTAWKQKTMDMFTYFPKNKHYNADVQN